MTGFLGFFDVVADKMRRGASGQQIPDTGLLSSANSGMTGCYGLFGFYWEFSEIPPISLKDIRSFQRFCSGLIKNALRKWIL
jgi:hypothetical protein